MAWNRSSNSQQTKTALRRGGTPRPTVVRGAIAALIVILCGAIAALLLLPDSKPNTKSRVTDSHSRIKEVQPAAAPKSQEVVEKAEAKPKTRPVYTKEEGQAALAARRAAGEKIRNLSIDSEGKPRFKLRFHNPAEREIERILIHTPGEPMMGIVRYDKNFEQKFVESLMNKVEILPDDTKDDIEIKQTMEETKKELVARIKAGENLGDILEESRREIDRLARYRSDLVKMIADARKDENNADDYVSDMIDAANKMLSDNGMRPVSKSTFMRHAIRGMIEKSNANKE